MKLNQKNLKTILIFAVTGIVCCTVLGFIFFGSDVFNTRSPMFQFPVYGFVGSVAFILFKLKSYRDALFILVLVFLLEYLLTGSRYLLTHLIYFSSVVLGVYLFLRYFYNRIRRIKYAGPLILAGIFGLLFVADMLLLSIIYSHGEVKFLPLKTMPIGFLIGLGVGIGIELSEYIKARYVK